MIRRLRPRVNAALRLCAAALVALACLPCTAPFSTWDLAPPPDAAIPYDAQSKGSKLSSDSCMAAIAGAWAAPALAEQPAGPSARCEHIAAPLVRLTVLRI